MSFDTLISNSRNFAACAGKKLTNAIYDFQDTYHEPIGRCIPSFVNTLLKISSITAAILLTAPYTPSFTALGLVIAIAVIINRDTLPAKSAAYLAASAGTAFLIQTAAKVVALASLDYFLSALTLVGGGAVTLSLYSVALYNFPRSP
jgi:hypothetical protein